MKSDPVRLLSQGDDPFARSLLRSARDGDAATARARKAAVLGAAGGAAVGGAALAMAAKLSTKGLWGALTTKWIVAGTLAAVGGIGLGAAAFWSRQPAPMAAPAAVVAPAEPPRAVAPADLAPTPADTLATAPAAEPPAGAAPAGDAPAAVDPAATPPAAADAPADAPAQPRSAVAASARAAATGAPAPAASPAPAATADAASELSEEVAALRSAREALGRGQPQKSLEAVNAYFARFPGGRLSAEARVLRIEAMYAGGQRAQAATLARAMLAQSPRTPYAARLRVIAGEDGAAKPQ